MGVVEWPMAASQTGRAGDCVLDIRSRSVDRTVDSHALRKTSRNR